MNRIGVIYIGENSVRLMLSEVHENGYFKIIDEFNSSVRMCYDLIDNPLISDEKISELFTTLRTFKSLCSVSGVNKIIAISSEALRLAENSEMITKKLKNELDLEIIILSTSSEIYYNYLAITNSIYFNNALLVNISGSTTHLAWILDNKIKESASFPIGTINLSSYFNLEDTIDKTDLAMCIDCIDSYIDNLPWLKSAKFDSIIGIGGTIRTLGKIDRARKRDPLDLTHNYIMENTDVNDVYNLVKSKNLKLRREIEALSFERSDIIVGGVTLINRIFNSISCDKLIISGRGVREGVMYEYITNTYQKPLDILNYNINGIIDSLNINKKHAQHVYSITLKLFNELKPIHRLGDEFNHIIKTSAMLHDCGISVDYYNHHKHSFYIIINSYINGLTHKELLLSGAIAASHRNNSYHLPLPKYCSILNRLDLHNVECIGMLLKIAEGLDRSLEGAATDINVEITKDTVLIKVLSDLDIEMEIKQALRSADKFKEIYHRDLLIEKA